MRIPIRRIVPWAGAAAVVYAMAVTHEGKEQPAGTPAASFSLQSVDGATVTLDSLRGRPLLVNFWASWCPPCRAELPDLQALWQAREGCLDVVGIAVQSGSAQEVADFARKRGVSYPLLLGDARVAQAWGVEGLPHSTLLDAEGRIVRSWEGQIDPRQVRAAVHALAPAVPSC